jgi:AcrR family transcriptional regulator
VTREKLLRAAREKLLKEGWGRTSAEAVRKLAGVSQGSLSHHFPGKMPQIAAEIHVELHRQVWHESMLRFERGSRRQPWIVLENGLVALIQVLETQLEEARLLFDLDRALKQTSKAGSVDALANNDFALLKRWYDEAEIAGKAPLTGRVLHALIFGAVIALARDISLNQGSAGFEGLLDRFLYAARAAISGDSAKKASMMKTEDASTGGLLVPLI